MRLLSLFSGCGGMDLGFKQAGYDIVWANDFDKDAQRVYRLNIGDLDERDIRQVHTSEVPDCDIITAGFPCQPFSNAGNRQGIKDERGTLFWDAIRFVEAKQPAVLVFENVRGLLSTHDGAGNKLIDIIANTLSETTPGYNIEYRLLNSSDYGVPQNRYRVFIVGIRKDLNIQFEFPHKQPKYGLEVKHVIDVPEAVPNQVDWKLAPQALSLINHIPEGGSWKDIPYDILPERFRKIKDDIKRYRAPNFYRRFSRDEINGTITASAQPENCGIIHPLENRRYNIREIARFQSFPDDFLFFDDALTGMYKVIGNAVPPRLAFVIAQQIKKQLGQAGN